MPSRQPAKPASKSITVRDATFGLLRAFGIRRVFGNPGSTELPVLADWPDESLVATILHGRPGTAMPGWQRFMNEAEAGWIVARLKQGFPEAD